ncbi:unnamed protein product [Sphagnum balticum]
MPTYTQNTTAAAIPSSRNTSDPTHSAVSLLIPINIITRSLQQANGRLHFRRCHRRWSALDLMGASQDPRSLPYRNPREVLPVGLDKEVGEGRLRSAERRRQRHATDPFFTR